MNVLGMFAKHWMPGQVKSRLAATIGEHLAAQLYFAFLRTLIGRLDHAGDRRIVVFAPAEAATAFAKHSGKRWQLQPQAEGDLGHRMAGFFDCAFAAGAKRVVLIGSDSPLLSAELIARAFEQLKHQRVVLGPAGDGGYYLVGAAGETPPIFAGIPWSTSDVLDCTLQHLDKARWNYSVLPTGYDVDELADLQRLQQDLSALPARDPGLAYLRQVLEKLRIVAGPPASRA